MKTLKYSRQRESIKSCLMNRCDHPTADALYTTLREQFPNISLGTVYRNLNLLVDLGEIKKIPSGDGIDHFDYDTSSAVSADASATCPCRCLKPSSRRPPPLSTEPSRTTR